MDSSGKNLDSDYEIAWNVFDVLDASSRNVKYAVLILNQPILNEPNLIKSLWKGADLRFTVDGGTNRWLKFIEENSDEDLPLPDCITGDFDSITEETKQYFKKKSVKFVETQDQDYTDFFKALVELMRMVKDKNIKLDHILAIVTNSGRVDHIMANLETLHSGKGSLNGIPLFLMSSNSLTWLLDGGKTHIINVPEQYVDESHAVGLIPLLGPTKVTTSGLKWNLDNTRMAFSELVSTSNTFSESTVKIMSELDLVWTVQYSLVDS